MKNHLLVLSLFCFMLLAIFLPPTLLAQWGPDVKLSILSSDSATASNNNAWCIAAGSSGLVHAVWFNYGDPSTIWYSRSIDEGISWSQEVPIDTLNADCVPSIAASGIYAHVVWCGEGNGGFKVFYKRSIDGGLTWSDTTCISKAEVGTGDSPSIVVSNSALHVVWSVSSPSGGNYGVFYRRSSDNGLTWSDTTCLAYLYSGINQAPGISISASGSNIHTVWFGSPSGAPSTIYYKRSTNGGLTWLGNTTLSSDTSYNPTVASSGANVHVVWVRFGSGIYKIYYRRSTDGGATWSTITTLYSGQPQCPSIATSGTNVHVVFEDYSPQQLHYRYSTDLGVTWSRDTVLSSNHNGIFCPSIAINGSVVHVVWVDWRTGYDFYYKRNPTGNIGVEEHMSPPQFSSLIFKVQPNPFYSYASVPGHEKEVFHLYDIAGRQVGSYRGDRLGSDLAPGVYFLRKDNHKPFENTIYRVVKVR